MMKLCWMKVAQVVLGVKLEVGSLSAKFQLRSSEVVALGVQPQHMSILSLEAALPMFVYPLWMPGE
jgi:hypothetical protein